DGGDDLVAVEKSIAELQSLVDPADKRPEFGYHSQIAAAQDSTKWVEVDLGRPVQVQSVVLHPCHDDYAGIGSGFGFPVRFQVIADNLPDRSAPDAARNPVTIADYSSQDVVNPGLAAVTIAGPTDPVRYVRVNAVKLAERSNDYILALAELRVIDTSGQNVALGAAVRSMDSIEAPVRWRRSNLTDGIWATAKDPDKATDLKNARARRAEILAGIETPERVERRKNLTTQRTAVAAELKKLPTGRMVYAAATHFAPQGNFRPTEGSPRTIRLLHRGVETQPGEPVEPGAIPLSPGEDWHFQLPRDSPEGQRRAALAAWITHRDNPLTWRSIVNRVWQYHFGRGIVDSPNDFGRMGQDPSHPEMLDWLAIQFRDGSELVQAQSLKDLHRLIVTSATYRQASQEDPAQQELDSGNRLLWRANRRRLEAEEIRDSVLAVSGRLDTTMYGPGFYLFELEKTEHSPHYEYHKFDPADAKSHRRSVYRFIVRSQPDPFMTTLDCADSSQSTPRRNETLTSLQALSLLNNRFSLVMAQYFAQRLESDGKNLQDQVGRAFELTTGRQPDQSEAGALHTYAKQHGLTNLCRILLNQSEFVFVE
ncbi:MAG: DUF1553 domain-containing protein, partial [Planctomycetaceae bacterium]|nr:DUF1553 domain-containing protein [Planctomycetaceae bacterium]